MLASFCTGQPKDFVRRFKQTAIKLLWQVGRILSLDFLNLKFNLTMVV